MPTIHLTHFVEAPIAKVFELSRNISIMKISAAPFKSHIVGGHNAGLLEKEDRITWKSKKLGKYRYFTSEVSEFTNNRSWKLRMVNGSFRKFEHEHHFKQAQNGTIIIDLVRVEIPWSFLGRVYYRLFLKKQLEKIIARQNTIIGQYATKETTIAAPSY